MGFEAIYKQTATVFNRRDIGGVTYWYAVVIPNVHLVTDMSIIISTYGEQSQDNAMLHIRYTRSGKDALIQTDSGILTYMTPKVFQRDGVFGENITFASGDDFDFIMAGEYPGLVGSLINDEEYPKGFFNYVNKEFDEVYAISRAAKFELIPHFELTAR